MALCYAVIAKSHSLSARETDVFMLLAQGRSRPYICEALYLSDGTVKTHISHIYRKFDVHGRQELLDAVQNELARDEKAEFTDIKN
ncbi:response regulator transcription factor [Slackia sp.]